MESTLSPIELHALGIVAKGATKVRNLLVAGTTPLDFGVQVTGDLVVNSDQQYSRPNNPDPVLIIAALLSYFGPRKRSTIVDEVLEAGLVKAVKDSEQTKALAESLVEGLKTFELSPRRGAVTGKFSVTPVRIK